eukprot:1345996-Rhodomonas_salina.1
MCISSSLPTCASAFAARHTPHSMRARREEEGEKRERGRERREELERMLCGKTALSSALRGHALEMVWLLLLLSGWTVGGAGRRELVQEERKVGRGSPREEEWGREMWKERRSRGRRKYGGKTLKSDRERGAGEGRRAGDGAHHDDFLRILFIISLVEHRLVASSSVS